MARPRVRRGKAKLCRSEGLRCGEATAHNMKNAVFDFCFVIPLLRGLVYWTNEDLISV